MKARKPNTDQDAQVVFCVNGKVATEYDMPTTAAIPRDDIAECFVPVEEGDRITIKGHFNGSVLNGAMDLLVDGSFLSDSRIEGTELKLVTNRKIEFKKALNCPIPPDWTSIESPTQLEEGPMYTRVLDQQEYGDGTQFELASRESAKPGLGSVQVIIYVTQRPGDYYYDKYPDITIGHWRSRDSQLVRKSGIQPEYELRLEVDDPEISQKRSSKHRRHFGATHFGYNPWARFIFYYRSEAAIKAAGCVERSDHVQALTPADKDVFIHGEAKRKKKQQSSTADEEDDAATATTINSPPSKMDRTPTQEQRQTPRKAPRGRLGGNLSLSREIKSTSTVPDGYHAAQPDSIKKFTGSTQDDDPFTQLHAAERSAPLASGRTRATTYNRSATQAATASGETSDEAMGFAFSRAAPDASYANARDGLTSGAALSSLSPLSLDQAGSPLPTKDSIDGDTTDMSRLDPSLAAVLRQVPTASTIRDSIPAGGLDEFGLHMMYLNIGILQHEAEASALWERRRNEVAIKDPNDGRWYRKPASKPKRGDSTSMHKPALHENQSSGIRAQQAPRPSTSFVPPDRQDDLSQDAVKIKEEEVDMDMTPATPTPAPAPAPFTPQPKSVSSAKRTASERTSPPGTQSPASKRAKKQASARLSKLRQENAAQVAKKEELVRKLKARDGAKAAKAEEKKRKAEERRLEAERLEAEEIAELERANADFHEELAAMERQLEEEDENDDDDESDGMEEESQEESEEE